MSDVKPNARNCDFTLPNGIRLVGEHIERSQGVALALRIPAGSKDDPADQLGLTGMVTDTLFMGTKKRNARALSDAFDFHGIRHSAQTGIESTSITLRFLPEHQHKALGLLREVLSEPSFPVKECATAKIQAIQEIKHLEDEPLSKVFVILKELYFGTAWGHPELGHQETIPNITRKDIVEFWKARFLPSGTIVAVAGKFDLGALVKDVETLFAGKNKSAAPVFEQAPPPPTANLTKHVVKESEQTQIALAFPFVQRNHADYFAAQVGVGVLAGGMSGRLFTEVREKRALVYSVGAQAASLRGSGVCYAYAGTTAKRASETLQVLKAELLRLPTDLSGEEVERAKTGYKAHMLMDQESTGSRARQLLDDVYFNDRVVPVGEVIEKIDAVTPAQIKTYWESHPIEPGALVTLGKEALA